MMVCFWGGSERDGHTTPPAANKIPQTASKPRTISSGMALMKRPATPRAATRMPKPPVKVEYRVVVGELP